MGHVIRQKERIDPSDGAWSSFDGVYRRTHGLAEVLDVSRGTAYYRPRPVSERDMVLLRRIDEVPFAGNRMLRRQRHDVGRLHVGTLTKKHMGTWTLYKKPNTSKKHPRHPVYPYLLRSREFVTRKITDGMAKIRLSKLGVLELGNLDAKRDWGYAKDYVDGMWRMLQADEPDTYVLATNRTETVRDFVTMAAKAAGFNLAWQGKAEQERGIDTATGKTIVAVNPKFYRPAEVDLLIGNPAKAKAKLGWEPTTTLEQLCAMMVEADLRRNAAGASF
ncbi:GDP-mannose 4,6-dehydratase [mine drainage metagenome]|uniref:GDP-mannose 4,6-dehydratase n=1 Tax=mine drainage metagenome TaxID=410659 RepID=A0A1J5RIR6_9ZZZZ